MEDETVTLLALETATDTCGVALLRDDHVIAETHLYRPRIHSAQLTPLIDTLLADADVEAAALDVVAVSMGPGSYTGLRIGVSTAKGWAMATGADFLGVPTLAAYAEQVRAVTEPDDIVCVLLDARRDEVYAAAFRRTTEDLDRHAETKALPIDALSSWLAGVKGRLWLLGDGVEKSREVLASVGTKQIILPSDVYRPSAAAVARRGRQRLAMDGPDDLSTFEPMYVKEVHATPAPSPFA